MITLRPAALAMLFAALLPPEPGRAEPACLPASLFPQEEGATAPELDLGLIGNAPTLCARPGWGNPGLFGCWAIDPAAGTLSASAATSLPGHSQWGKTDSNGCIEGYCTVPKADADESVLWAVSTSGAHAAIVRKGTLHIFDSRTKAQLKAIPSAAGYAVKIAYLGSTIYIADSDAGPYIAVRSYNEDGTPMDNVIEASEPRNHSYSIFNGSLNIVDDRHVALVDAGLQTMLILSPIDGTRELRIRQVSRAPCTEAEMDRFNYEDFDALSKRCRKTVAKSFEPYIDLIPVRLPSGDFLATLSGKSRGSLAILDGRTLREKRRIELPRCAQ